MAAPESKKKERKEVKNEISRAWREDIRRAVDVMSKGGVILYPTDTIWGIGCDAQNEAAVRRVFEIKQRADAKALISLVDSAERVQRYIRNVPAVAWDVMDCSVSPITIIFDGASGLAPNLLAEDGSAAIRVTKETFSRELCYRMQRAIVSTSANISGEPSPRCFDEISEELKGLVDYVCTSRRNEKNPAASSIIRIREGGEVQIIRK